MVGRVLIIGASGTHSPEGRANVSRLINAVRREANGVDVVDGYVDEQSPALADVVRTTTGPRVIVPLIVNRDPTLLRAMSTAARLDPAVTVTAPVGPDWVLAEIGVQRLIDVGARPDDTIVLAAQAAPDDDAAADDIAKSARLLSAIWGGRIHVGTLGEHGDSSSLSNAIDIARSFGQRVVVSSYVLAAGVVHDEILHCGADLVTTPLVPSGPPDPRLVGLVLARARSRGGWLAAGESERRAAHG